MPLLVQGMARLFPQFSMSTRPPFSIFICTIFASPALSSLCGSEGHVSNTQGMGSGDWEEAVGGERLLFQYSHRVLSGEGLGQTLLRDTEEQQITLML